MSFYIDKISDVSDDKSLVFLVNDLTQLKSSDLSEAEVVYIRRKESADKKNGRFFINRLNRLVAVLMPDQSLSLNDRIEWLRREGAAFWNKLKEEGLKQVQVVNLTGLPQSGLALAEGLVLGAYSFEKYKTTTKETLFPEVGLLDEAILPSQIEELIRVCEAVYLTRDLVNEPVGTLNAVKLGSEVMSLANQYGFKAEVFNKAKIEAMKMGGLMAVNQGSIDPPTFSVLEWHPDNAVNTEPYVLVGKGVVFDTGGINLKTPPGSLDTMKCDMGGAAAVIGAFVAIAANKLPVHVVGLIPATDNRPGGNAIVPGDVIKMHNGTTVEVMNTDAEGRLILGDALSFSANYKPRLVIDLATLTGNAAIALGEHGTVGMGTADDITMRKLADVGNEVCERVVWFPFWSDFDDLIKSEVADIKNIGGREGGAITAGKFLSHFVDAPWLHLDIAGPAFVLNKANYRGIGGTGVGVRLLYHFLKSQSK
ncbi:leucyl aminopeptidase family protein [Geofilum sp. OHC36d9]|uniref:leucyl aminopeptidase family protein n=1 Tax=Geofilum sp. OHC36d9 TaxID=3458413 RepID=UPI004033CED2